MIGIPNCLDEAAPARQQNLFRFGVQFCDVSGEIQ